MKKYAENVCGWEELAVDMSKEIMLHILLANVSSPGVMNVLSQNIYVRTLELQKWTIYIEQSF